MRWWLTDIDDAIKKANKKVSQVADSIKQELQLKDNDFYLVGGFVRDSVMSSLYGEKDVVSKDFDIIFPKKPNLQNNPNIIWKKENSFGGIKLGTKNFSEIDIFNEYTSDPYIMVGLYFDFTCNSLFYSHYYRQISPSVYFYDFIGRKVIDLVNFVYVKDGAETRYSEESMVSRALKFQIQFKEKFGIETNLSKNILYFLYNMDKDTEQKMFEYTRAKVKNQELQNKIINEYKNLRSH